MSLEQLGKYKIISRIGRGAMGEVWKAYDPVLGRDVAVKTISASLSSDNDLRQRFHREAQAAARLNHPNIITIFEYGEEQDTIYMAMELLEGADLRNLIGQDDLLPTLDDKLDIMQQICDGLAFAHSREVIHRDLKPGNIHVQPNGQVKILDFGLARLGTSEMTRTGTVMGTPHYMSPEQVLGDKVELSSDVFSIGAVFYELLSSHKPFDGDSAHAVLFQVVNKFPEGVRKWKPDLPPILVDVVERAMMKDRKQRFHDASQLREALAVARRAINEGRGESSLAAEVALNIALPKSAGDSFRSTGPKSRPAIPTNQQFADGTAGDSASRSASASGGPAPVPQSRPSSSRPGAARGRGGTSPPGRSGHTTRSGRPVRPAPVRRSKAPWIVGVAALVVLVGAAGLYLVLSARSGTPSPSPSGTDERVGALTEALASTQVELARRDLDDKNYQSAVAQADRALKLAPGSAEARQVKRDAEQALQQVNAAAAEAKAKLEAGDMNGASEALGRLLALDPKHPVATELTARLNSSFQQQAEDARREAARARSQAEKVQAQDAAAFGEAAAAVRSAEAQLARGEFAEATQGFLDARDTFDRARRAAEAAAREAARASAPTPEPDRTASQRGRVTPTPAPSLAPPTTVAAAQPTPAPSGKSISLLAPRRTFVSGETVIRSASDKKGPAGFDTEDVNVNPEFRCQIRFDATPPAVRPGEDYEIRVFMINKGEKTLRIRDLTLTTASNGTRSTRPAAPETREVPVGGAAPIASVTGAIEPGVTSWSLEAVVSSPKGDVCTSRVAWK